MAKKNKTVWIIQMNAGDDGEADDGVEHVASGINSAAELMHASIASYVDDGDDVPSEGAILNALLQNDGDGVFEHDTGYGVLNVAQHVLDA